MQRGTFQKLAAVAIAFVMGGVVMATQGAAEHQPADKMAVSGASIDILTAPLNAGASSEEHTILSGTLRTSAPTDLILRVTTECALWTDVTTVGNDASEASATVKVWVEIDGAAVVVSDGDADGKVVFCNRVHGLETMDFDDEDARIRNYLRTRTANAFNWIDLNLGAGVHTVEVVAQLEVQVNGMGEAQAGVGKRTLIVEPVKLGNDVSI